MSHHPPTLLKEMDPRANAFLYKGGPQAALLIHGFTGSPAEMLPVGDLLAKNLGWTVSCPLLPGHGTTEEDLDRFLWTDWFCAIEEEWNRLRKECSTCHVIGLSMGALLAIELFQRHAQSIASLVLISPGVWSRPWKFRYVAPFLGWKFIADLSPGFQKGDPPEDHVCYDHYPPHAAAEYFKLSARARRLKKMKAPPTFICISETDDIVHPKSATFLADRLINDQSRVLRLKQSNHVITKGTKKDTFLTELEHFYKTLFSS